MSSDIRRESLFRWVESLPPYSSQGTLPQLEHFRDGVILGQILREEVDPSGFSDLSSNPKHPSPLAFIVAKMKRYFAQQEHGHVIPFSLSPNLGKILSSGNETEICKLLQLLLVCALSAPSSQRFTTNILNMSQDHQHEIMSAVQEIQGTGLQEPLEAYNSNPLVDAHLQQELSKAKHEILKLKQENTELAEKSHELLKKLDELTDEIVSVIEENKQLRRRSTSSQDDDAKAVSTTLRLLEEKRVQIEKLREENILLENSLDDATLKLAVYEKELEVADVKLVTSAGAQEEIQKLQDEIDCLQEAAGKVSQYEQSLKVYKKALEEEQDLKQRVKQLEEINAGLKQKNLEITPEQTRGQIWKTQFESLKTELVETQIALSKESKRALLAESAAKTYKEAKEMLERLHQDGWVSDGNSSKTSELTLQDQFHRVDSETRQELMKQVDHLEAENQSLKQELKMVIDSNPSEEGIAVLLKQLRQYELELQENVVKLGEEMGKMQNSHDDKLAALQLKLNEKDDELKAKEAEHIESMENLKSLILYLGPLYPEGALDNSFGTKAVEQALKLREFEEQLLSSTFYNYGIALHQNAREISRESLLQRKRREINKSLDE